MHPAMFPHAINVERPKKTNAMWTIILAFDLRPVVNLGG